MYLMYTCKFLEFVAFLGIFFTVFGGFFQIINPENSSSETAYMTKISKTFWRFSVAIMKKKVFRLIGIVYIVVNYSL